VTVREKEAMKPNKRRSRKAFTVAIFGSARISRNDPIYHRVYRLGRWIGSKGFDVVTGGGPGIMDAANKGHRDGRKNHKTFSVGLNIILPREQKPNKHLDIKKEFHRFSGRLDTFMLMANVVVVAPGGIGTLLEFFYAWQLIQVRDVVEVPVILVGDMWMELMEWVGDWPLRRKLLSRSDLDSLFLVKNNSEAMRIIEATHDAYRRGEKVSCRELKRRLARAERERERTGEPDARKRTGSREGRTREQER
jgi:uncharacterized protein (TIGR00730 family)